MTNDEFLIHFNKLSVAFTTTNLEGKSKIYFEELRQIEPHVFATTVRKWIREGDKFPSISNLLRLSDTIKPLTTNAIVYEECPDCDGYGWAFFLDHAFRARCRHGSKLSQLIAFVPISQIDQANWTRQIEKDNHRPPPKCPQIDSLPPR